MNAHKSKSQRSKDAHKSKSQRSKDAHKSNTQRSKNADKSNTQRSKNADKSNTQRSKDAHKSNTQRSKDADKSKSQRPKNAHKSKSPRSKNAHKATPTTNNASKCCGGPRIPPPAYLDYRASECGGGNLYKHYRGRTGNPILDMLKNVDVIEELKYYVPDGEDGGECNDQGGNANQGYVYVCNCCGEMEPSGTKEKTEGKPVTYSRRQRFNFTGTNNGADPDDSEDDGPPYLWPGSNCCTCPCCIAGLRRNPKCECKCCEEKGKNRTVNSFDEIPVGKNPEPKDIKPYVCDNDEEDDDDSEDQDEECNDIVKLLPSDSGVYFYDAEEKVFIRQVPRTPTPIIIQQPSEPPQHEILEPICCPPDIREVLRCLPPRQMTDESGVSTPVNIPPPQPIIMPPIYNCGDMKACFANLINCCEQKQPTNAKPEKVSIPSSNTNKNQKSSTATDNVSPKSGVTAVSGTTIIWPKQPNKKRKASSGEGSLPPVISSGTSSNL